MDVSETPEMEKSGLAYLLGRIPAGREGGLVSWNWETPCPICRACHVQAPTSSGPLSELRASGTRTPPWGHGGQQQDTNGRFSKASGKMFYFNDNPVYLGI